MPGIMTIEEETAAKILYLLNYKIPNEYYDLYMKLTKDSEYYEFSGNQWNTKFNVRNELLFINQNRLKSLNNIKTNLEDLIQIFSNDTKKKEYLKEEKERRNQLIKERENTISKIMPTDSEIDILCKTMCKVANTLDKYKKECFDKSCSQESGSNVTVN